MSLLDVAGTAAKLLQLVVDVATEESIDLPDRQYVTAGTSGAEGWDDEQVVVGISNLIPGNAARPAALVGQSTSAGPGAPMLMSAVLRVEIVRCTPGPDDNGKPPSASELNTAGLEAMRDAALLHLVRVKATEAATLTPGGRADILPGNVQPAGPEGGLSGMALTITVTVGDLEPA